MTDPDVGMNVELRHDRDAYLKRIDECLDEISAGESYEICLTNMVTVHTPIDLLPTFAHLRRISPVPYGALLDFRRRGRAQRIPGAVPVDRRGTASVEAKPIKGTRPAGARRRRGSALRRGPASTARRTAPRT